MKTVILSESAFQNINSDIFRRYPAYTSQTENLKNLFFYVGLITKWQFWKKRALPKQGINSQNISWTALYLTEGKPEPIRHLPKDQSLPIAHGEHLTNTL